MPRDPSIPAAQVYGPAATPDHAPSNFAPAPPSPTHARGILRRWFIRSPTTANDPDTAHISATAATNPTRSRAGSAARPLPLRDRVLAARGLHHHDEITAYLSPRLTHLHDPALFHGIDRACTRILDALHAREPIVIYADYDADGVTAGAILQRTLRHLAPDAPVSTHIPRRDEGYGLSVEAIEQLAASARVIISVDCGITAVEPARAARRAGTSLIITDHHNPPAPGEPWPDAHAIIHPRAHLRDAPASLSSSSASAPAPYPFEHLSGAGVAYKLAWRLLTLAAGSAPAGRVDDASRTLLLDLLPLAALGTIADVVPLVGENRVLARFGLERMKHSAITGVRALVLAARLDADRVSTWDVGFRLAPRLNASGRMAHAALSLELLTTNDAARAQQIANELELHNTQRRTLEQTICEEAAQRAEISAQTTPDHRAIVLADPAWHRGVIGIVCSRLVDRFARPTILCTHEDGLLHASARSVEGFNLHAALAACSAHLTSFGGHDMAAGLTLRPEALDAFRDAFVAVCNQHLAPDDLARRLWIDAATTTDELSLQTVRDLDALEPCGSGNPAVALLLARARIEREPTPMGKGGEHLALELSTLGSQRTLRCVAWRMGHLRPQLRRAGVVDAVVRPAISNWTGSPRVEPEIIDLRLA